MELSSEINKMQETIKNIVPAMSRQDLKNMESLRSRGYTISHIWQKYNKYSYWDIYWSLKDTSFLGTKRKITNRLNKLNNNENKELIKEIKKLVDKLYLSSIDASKKLQGVAKALDQ